MRLLPTAVGITCQPLSSFLFCSSASQPWQPAVLLADAPKPKHPVGSSVIPIRICCPVSSDALPPPVWVPRVSGNPGCPDYILAHQSAPRTAWKSSLDHRAAPSSTIPPWHPLFPDAPDSQAAGSKGFFLTCVLNSIASLGARDWSLHNFACSERFPSRHARALFRVHLSCVLWGVASVMSNSLQSCGLQPARLRSSVHGVLRGRILEWAPISFSRGIFPTQGIPSLIITSSRIHVCLFNPSGL